LLSEQQQGYPHYKRGTLFYKSNGLSVALSTALTSRFLRSKTEIKEVQMTNLVEEQSEWVLTFDYEEGQLHWNSHIPLWEATAMLEGLFRGIGVVGADIPTYIRRNYEQRVTVQCGDTTYFEGMLGNLARIALDELRDEELQNEKRSAPAQGRGTR
jgi:hypothetical protein